MRPNPNSRHLPPNPTSAKHAVNPYESIAFEDLQNHSGATFDQRLIALTIDILFLTFIGKGLDSLLELFDINDDLISFVVIAGYFTLMHWWYGFTIGKYFVGLRVIGEGARHASGFSRIFFRETAGKLVSLVPLGIGFFVIIFSRERLSWHDRLSQTKVISLKDVESSVGKQLMRGALAVLVLLSISLGLGGFTVLMTPVPLENLQQRLTWAGIHLSQIKGSLLKGYSIGQIHWSREGNKVVLEDIQIKIDPWSFLVGRGNIHVKTLTVGSGEIEATGATTAGKPDVALDDEPATEDESFLTQFTRSVRIDSMDIGNIKLRWGKTDLLVQRVFSSEFNANLDEFRFGRLYFDSSKLQFDVSDFKIRQGVIEMPAPLKGTVKAALAPDLIKTDVTFAIKAWGNREKPDFEVSVFNSQIKLTRQDKKVTFQSVDWSPVNYFKGYWAIAQVNLKSEGSYEDSADLTAWTVAGDFRVLPVVIKISEGQQLASVIQDGLKAENWQNGEKTSFVMKPHFFHDKQIWAQAYRNGQPLPLAEALATTRGRKSMAELSDSERILVERDVEFFSKSFLGVENLIQAPHAGRQPSAVQPEKILDDPNHIEEDDEDEVSEAGEHFLREPAAEQDDDGEDDVDDEPIENELNESAD